MHKLFEIPSIALFLCTFCASLRLTRTVFSWLLKKAVSMALWTMASLCFKSSLLEQSLPGTPSRLRIIFVNPVILSNFSSCPRALLGEKIREIRVNPCLIKDLRACEALYNCRDTFTDVMSALQIKLFMQNKAKFRKSQMNVNKVLTKDYDKMDTWWSGKNKPKRTQNEPKFKKAKMNVTSILTKDYENISNWAICENEPNTKPNKPNLRTEYCKFIDDYPFILYTGVLYKKKPNMEKQ